MRRKMLAYRQRVDLLQMDFAALLPNRLPFLVIFLCCGWGSECVCACVFVGGLAVNVIVQQHRRAACNAGMWPGASGYEFFQLHSYHHVITIHLCHGRFRSAVSMSTKDDNGIIAPRSRRCNSNFASKETMFGCHADWRREKFALASDHTHFKQSIHQRSWTKASYFGGCSIQSTDTQSSTRVCTLVQLH